VLVRAVNLKFVSRFVTVTVTSGTADPVGSATEPVIVEVPICATTKNGAENRDTGKT